MKSIPLSERIKRINHTKFSFGKNNEFSKEFAHECEAFSMHDSGFGLGIPGNLSAANQLRAVFTTIRELNGVFLFNISGVNLKKAIAGFPNFDEAEYNNQITEWELSVILSNKDYKKNVSFTTERFNLRKDYYGGQ
jgi:hypothetical protein